jgi:hypothetical protein
MSALSFPTVTGNFWAIYVQCLRYRPREFLETLYLYEHVLSSLEACSSTKIFVETVVYHLRLQWSHFLANSLKNLHQQCHKNKVAISSSKVRIITLLFSALLAKLSLTLVWMLQTYFSNSHSTRYYHAFIHCHISPRDLGCRHGRRRSLQEPPLPCVERSTVGR